MKREVDLENCTFCGKRIVYRKKQAGIPRKYCSTTCKDKGRSWIQSLKRTVQRSKKKSLKREARNLASKKRHEEVKIKDNLRHFI